MTRPGIEPRSPGLLANTLPTGNPIRIFQDLLINWNTNLLFEDKKLTRNCLDNWTSSSFCEYCYNISTYPIFNCIRRYDISHSIEMMDLHLDLNTSHNNTVWKTEIVNSAGLLGSWHEYCLKKGQRAKNFALVSQK